MEIAQINFNRLYQELRPSGGAINFNNLTLGGIINALLPFLFVLAGLSMLLFLVYGGFMLLTSGGDPKAVSSAKEKITFAIVGFVIVFISFWLVQIIGRMFGIQPIIDIFG